MSIFGTIGKVVTGAASVVPGIGGAVTAVTGIFGSGSGGAKPAPGSPGEGYYYGFSPEAWESLNAGNRGHVRSGDAIGQQVIAKSADLLPNTGAANTIYSAGQLAGAGGDISKVNLYGVPTWVWPAAAGGLALLFILSRWRKKG